MDNKPLKILVVDDNVELCRNVTDILELHDHQVQVAHNGLEAVDRVRNQDFDWALMDMKMPHMNGVEAFKRMKEINPRLHAVMMTAYALEDLMREALKEGAHGCLRKPINYDKLLELISAATPS